MKNAQGRMLEDAGETNSHGSRNVSQRRESGVLIGYLANGWETGTATSLLNGNCG